MCINNRVSGVGRSAINRCRQTGCDAVPSCVGTALGAVPWLPAPRASDSALWSVSFHFWVAEAQRIFPYAFVCLCRALWGGFFFLLFHHFSYSAFRSQKHRHFTCDLQTLKLLTRHWRARRKKTVYLSEKKEISEKAPPKLNSHSSPVIFSGGSWEILLIWTVHALGTENQPYPRQYCLVMHLGFAESSCFSPEILVFIKDTKSSWLKFIQYILSTLIYSVFVCSPLGLIVIVILLTDTNSSLSLQWLLPVPIERGKKTSSDKYYLSSFCKNWNGWHFRWKL